MLTWHQRKIIYLFFLVSSTVSSSSSNFKDSPDKHLLIKKITDKLIKLLINLTVAKKSFEAPKETIEGQDVIIAKSKKYANNSDTLSMHSTLSKSIFPNRSKPSTTMLWTSKQI